MIWTLLTILLILFIIQWKSKIDFTAMKKGKTPIKATVIEYRKRKSPMRNDYSKIPYPYVQIQHRYKNLTKLKYANSLFKPFKISEEVEVFLYNGTLYYWNAYDKGILKYLS